MDKLKLHKQTVKNHRRYVREMCFKMGIPLQGLLHDLSKYSKEELAIAKWYTGKISPHDVARSELGYSPAWIFHRNKNKHHSDFWYDFSKGEYVNGQFIIKPVAMKMPYKYVIEMFCDFIGAGKAYSKDSWTTDMPWDYYQKDKQYRLYHKDTQYLFEKLLWNLHEIHNLDAFVIWYKSVKKYLKTSYENGTLSRE